MLEVLFPSPAPHSTVLRSHPAPLPPVQRQDIFHLSGVRGIEEFFPINVNIKMLPGLKGNTNPAGNADDGSKYPSSTSREASKLFIPQKEKFLVGFRGFDAPVGLPDSPTECTLSEADGYPIASPPAQFQSDSLPRQHLGQLPNSISEPQFGQTSSSSDTFYVADGFRPGASSTPALPSYDAIYGAIGQDGASAPSSANQAAPLPMKTLRTVPSLSMFRSPSTSSSSTPSTPATPVPSTPQAPLIYARFPESQPPQRISMPARAPSTPGLAHNAHEILRIQLRSNFSQFFKTMQFTCTDAEKCLLYGYSDSSSMKVPWNVPLERALRQLWKQVMEYDAACDKVKPESQSSRELGTYHAVAMGLISSDLPSDKLCVLWDRALAFSTPARKQFVQGWLSFTEFVAVVWMVGMATTMPAFNNVEL